MAVVEGRRRASDLASGQLVVAGPGAGERRRLLERDVLLAEWRALLSRKWPRPVGAVVFEGHLGVGKSALLGAFCAVAAEEGWAVLRASGDPTSTGSPFDLLQELLASHKGTVPGTDPPEVVLAELGALTDELAATTGMVVAVDDARWADDASIEWLSRLERSPGHRGIRLVLAASARAPGTNLRPVDWLIAERSSRVMPLGPLSLDAVGRLAEDFFGCPPEAAFVRACHEASGGNPSFVLALLRELVLEHIGPDAGAVGRVREVTSSGVARSLLARLSLVPPDAARLLEVVAVAGVPVDLELAAAVARLDVPRASAAAEDLARVDLLAGDRLLGVRPPLVRRTLLAEIPSRRRRRLHAALAEALRARWAPVEQQADHLLEGDVVLESWAVGVLEEAATLALAHGAPERAVQYLDRALAAERSTSGRLELLVKQARAAALVDPEAALEHLRVAVERGVAPTSAAQAALEVSRALARHGRAGAAIPVLAVLGPRLAREGSPAALDVLVVSVLAHRGPLPAGAVTALGDAAAGHVHELDAAGRRGAALVGVVDALSATGPASAEVASRLQGALAGSQMVGDDPFESELWARALLALARAGDLDEAERLATAAEEASRREASELTRAELATTLAQVLVLRGDLPAAEEAATAARSLTGGRAWPRHLDADACLLQILLDAGRLEEADQLVAVAPDPRSSEPSPLDAHLLLEQRGRLRRTQGEWSDALCDLLAAGQWAGERGIDNPSVTAWRAEAAATFAAIGRAEEAVRLASEHLELARGFGAEWAVGAALVTLATVTPDGERLPLFEEAVTVLEGTSARLEHARALVGLGRELRVEGSATRARATLRQGADLAMEVGCPPLVDAAMSELRLTGARPRRPVLRGAGALTAGERRVALLAAAGRTNAEIAGELYLAEKTVEGHLFRAFRKLGVTSRRQLGAALGARSEGGGQDRRAR